MLAQAPCLGQQLCKGTSKTLSALNIITIVASETRCYQVS